MASSSTGKPIYKVAENAPGTDEGGFQMANGSFRRPTPHTSTVADKAMVFNDNNCSNAQRLILVYADSSDEEDRDEDSLVEDAIDEGFSMYTNTGKRADSLREIVFLKDSKQGSYSFNEKQKGKRLTITAGGGSRCKQIQLNSKQIAFYDQEFQSTGAAGVLSEPSDRRYESSKHAMIAVNEEQEQSLDSPKNETTQMLHEKQKQQLGQQAREELISGRTSVAKGSNKADAPSKVLIISSVDDGSVPDTPQLPILKARETNAVDDLSKEEELEADSSLLEPQQPEQKQAPGRGERQSQVPAGPSGKPTSGPKKNKSDSQKQQRGSVKMDSITEGFESQDIESTIRTMVNDSVARTPKNISASQSSQRDETQATKKGDKAKTAMPSFQKKQTYGEVRTNLRQFQADENYKIADRSAKYKRTVKNLSLPCEQSKSGGEQTQKFQNINQAALNQESFGIQRKSTCKRSEVTLGTNSPEKTNTPAEQTSEVTHKGREACFNPSQGEDEDMLQHLKMEQVALSKAQKTSLISQSDPQQKLQQTQFVLPHHAQEKQRIIEFHNSQVTAQQAALGQDADNNTQGQPSIPHQKKAEHAARGQAMVQSDLRYQQVLPQEVHPAIIPSYLQSAALTAYAPVAAHPLGPHRSAWDGQYLPHHSAMSETCTSSIAHNKNNSMYHVQQQALENFEQQPQQPYHTGFVQVAQPTQSQSMADSYSRSLSIFSPVMQHASPINHYVAISRNGLIQSPVGYQHNDGYELIDPLTQHQQHLLRNSNQHSSHHQLPLQGTANYIDLRASAAGGAADQRPPGLASTQKLFIAQSPKLGTTVRPRSSSMARNASRSRASNNHSDLASPIANNTQFMFQAADMAQKPKRVRPTTAAQNAKLLQRAIDTKHKSRETVFSSLQREQNIEEAHPSPTCSRERCRDLIKQQLLLKQQTRARRGVASNTQQQNLSGSQGRSGSNKKLRSSSFQQPRQMQQQASKTTITEQLSSTQKVVLASSIKPLENLESAQIVIPTSLTTKTQSPQKQQQQIKHRNSSQEMDRRSSYRKLKMLPWCKDERDEIMHTEYIRFLAQMDSKQRSKATKHAISAASSLLRIKRGVGSKTHMTDMGGSRAKSSQVAPTTDGPAQSLRRVAWHEQEN